MKFISLVALLLPALLLGEAKINSNNNMLFSYYKPNKSVFIQKAKNHYLSNEILEHAYKHPRANPKNALIYAAAMDYVYEDGSDRVKDAYELAAFSIKGSHSFVAILQYADFLIRTHRYEELEKIRPKMCERDAPQCVYYKVVAKHLTNKHIPKEECEIAMEFLPMRKVTLQMCE